jgi:dTDP-L-rhamnose 4-epimerase
MKKILITGGAGFIGSNLTELLKEIEVTIIDNLNPQVHKSNPINISCHKFIKEDIQNVTSDLLDNYYDIIFHLASETGTGQSMYEIKKYSDTNIIGTVNLLELISKFKRKPQKIILTSSRSVYGEGKYHCTKHGDFFPNLRLNSDLNNKVFDIKCPICKKTAKIISSKESDVLNPTSIYASTKLAQENLIKNFCYYNDIDYTILRLQNVYGKGQSLNNPYTGILSIFSNQILNNETINIFEDGNESRDFIYVDDVINILYECISNDQTNNQIINVGNGNKIKIIDIVKKLIDIYKQGNYKITGNFRLGDIRSNYANLGKFNQIFSYRNKININTGLKLLSDWVKSQY